MKSFTGNEYPTVGVEEEFHLIDADTADLSPGIDQVLPVLSEELRSAIDYELFLAVLEHKSPVCRTIDELVQHVTYSRREIARGCEQVGLKLVAAGSHPFADWRQTPHVQDEHYRWVAQQCVYLAHRLMAFGLHVHVGMRTAQSALYAMYELRRWIYPLLALSANSPFYEGHLTGLASTRSHIFTSMPRSRMPPFFKDFSELEVFFNKLVAAGDITRPGDLWWVIRPQPPLGTIELRVFDMPTDARRLGALAALTQSALALYQDLFFEGRPPTRINPDFLDHNHWKAMRFGLDCDIIDPTTEEIISMRDQLHRFFDLLQPKAEELSCLDHLHFARSLLNHGNESQWQIQTAAQLQNDLPALEHHLASHTLHS